MSTVTYKQSGICNNRVVSVGGENGGKAYRSDHVTAYTINLDLLEKKIFQCVILQIKFNQEIKKSFRKNEPRAHYKV